MIKRTYRVSFEVTVLFHKDISPVSKVAEDISSIITDAFYDYNHIDPSSETFKLDPLGVELSGPLQQEK